MVFGLVLNLEISNFVFGVEKKVSLVLIATIVVQKTQDRGNIEKAGDPRPHIKDLDSGASETVIGSRGWKRLKDLSLETMPYDSEVKIANGHRCKTELNIILPIECYGKLCLIKALLVPDIDCELIVGVDFWKSMDLVPLLSDNNVKFREHVVASIDINSERKEWKSWLHTVREFYRENASHLTVLELPSGTSSQLDRLNALKGKYFALMNKGLGLAKGVVHVIDTGDSAPIKR
ncbi:hypothetical protein HHI36_002225 [Cryptolaemus montrouzieri]|uniref:Uncharacterized protein n=1 Tax=Cryptolaemus montrouzieri TaxID=559131 RepID=A0ABD2P9W2_9CUCU